MTSSRAVVSLMFGAVIISFSPVFVRLAHVAPTVSAFYRMAIGGVVLVVMALTAGRVRPGVGYLVWCVGLGATLAVDLAVWHRAIGIIGPGLATVLGNLQVLFVAAYGIVVERERPTRRFLLSLPLALVGIWLVFGLQPQMTGPDHRLGLVLGMITALAYAAFLIGLRHTRASWGGVAPVTTVALFTVASAMLLAGSAAVEGVSLVIPDRQTLLALLGLGIVVQVLGWVTISRALPHVEVSRAGLLLLLQPALAYVWDVLLFGRRPGPVELAGVAVVLVGIYLGMSSDQGRGGQPSVPRVTPELP